MSAKRFKDKHSNGAWWIGLQPTVNLFDLKEGTWTAADEGAVQDAADRRDGTASSSAAVGQQGSSGSAWPTGDGADWMPGDD
jgi:hypothetical protein